MKTETTTGPQVIAALVTPRSDENLLPRSSTTVRDLVLEGAERVLPLLHDDEELIIDAASGQFVLRLPAMPARRVHRRLDAIVSAITSRPIALADGTTQWMDVGVGWSDVPAHATASQRGHALLEAQGSAHDALRQRDLVVKRAGAPARVRSRSHRALAIQVAVSLIITLLLPYAAMVVMDELGIDISTYLYWILVVALSGTAGLIWLESLHALAPDRPPPVDEDQPAPPASAIFTAYLPNEAETIVETITHVLAQEYSGDLQIILAYNTPHPHRVEESLRDLSDREPRLLLLHVPDSVSKAQNVNAAIPFVTGEFVGVFDADHHLMPGAFERARTYIQSGVDVVQGHCVIRNGEQSRIARVVAAEFEQIYGVSHPGRASLHGFGIFGGSNGYWRTTVLRSIRMRTDRLTEDIDASIRATLAGFTIVSDPGLISYELAPVTMGALWRQRLRWAQGWLQVSSAYLRAATTAPHLSAKQRAGMAILLGWREIVPWLTPLAIPLLVFKVSRDGATDLFTPILLMATLFVLTAGPVQVLVAHLRATPSVRQHRWWFVTYLLVSMVVYSEAKNLVIRIAALKQLWGEHEWSVTPRTSLPALTEYRDPAVVPVAWSAGPDRQDAASVADVRPGRAAS